jgi:hypothetical protein
MCARTRRTATTAAQPHVWRLRLVELCAGLCGGGSGAGALMCAVRCLCGCQFRVTHLFMCAMRYRALGVPCGKGAWSSYCGTQAASCKGPSSALFSQRMLA